jgi:hypothetical protein
LGPFDPDESQDLPNTKKMHVIPAKAGTSLILNNDISPFRVEEQNFYRITLIIINPIAIKCQLVVSGKIEIVEIMNFFTSYNFSFFFSCSPPG